MGRPQREYKFILSGHNSVLNKAERDEVWGSLKEAKAEAIEMSKRLNGSVSVAKVLGHVHVENIFYLWK